MKTIKFHYTLGTKVTLKEMYSIFWKNREYDFFRNLNQMEKPQSFEGYEMPYDLPWETQNSPLLYRHIVAEQLYAKGEKWSYGFPRDYFHVGLLLKLAKLWMNPLVWDYDYFYQKIVVEGRVAKEKYTPEREKSVRQMISAQQEQYILDFADESPICKEDDPLHGSIKGLHCWTVLTWNLDPLFEKVLDGKDYSEEEITQAKSYDAAYLRKNLSIVAAYRSGKRAAKLLRDFREEWKQIKIWQSESSNMSEKDMQQFEIILFHGFDDLLEEWEAAEVSLVPVTPSAKPALPKIKPSSPMDRAIKAVYDANLCKSPDWAAVIRIFREGHLRQDNGLDVDADYINAICGEIVTNKKSLERAFIVDSVEGTFPRKNDKDKTGWKIKTGLDNPKSKSLFKRYLEIGEKVVSILDE